MHSHPALTADTLLEPHAVPVAVREADLAGSILPGAPKTVRDLVADRLTAALQSQLGDIDVGAIVLEAWSRFSELRAAAERTLADPRAHEDVALADHEVTSEHHPTLALWIDGCQVASVTLDVELTLTVCGLVAVVRGGRMTALRGGVLTAEVGLSWADRDLLTPPAVTLLAGYAVRLGAGIPLARGAARPASSRPRVAGWPTVLRPGGRTRSRRACR